MENGKKKANIKFSILVFFPTIYLATLKVYTKFEDWLSKESRSIWQKIQLEGKMDIK